MNECLFFSHSIIVVCFIYGAFYLGKEALLVITSSCWLFANFFLSKEILLFGWEVTASDVYAIGGMFGLSLLQEYWGRKAASQVVLLGFILLVFATLAAFIHVRYIPSLQDTAHEHYAQLLSSQGRFLAASFVTFALVQQLEISLFRFLQQVMPLPFLIRACMTSIVVQFIDTAFFSILGLYGIVHSLIDVITVSYFIKLLITFFTFPLLALAQYIVPKNTLYNYITYETVSF